MTARSWMLLSLVLGACDPDVLVVDGGHRGGAGGAGSPPAGRHLLAVSLGAEEEGEENG